MYTTNSSSVRGSEISLLDTLVLKRRGIHSGSRTEEEWRGVFKYELTYEISNFGRLRNKKNKKLLYGRVGAPGYIHFYLKGKNYYAHRLVALAFVPNPYHKNYVNHKDGNKVNNYIKNLEWCTAKENDIHARKIGLKKYSGYGWYNHKLTKKNVFYIRKSTLSQRTLAKKFGVSHTTIGEIIHRTIWKHI